MSNSLRTSLRVSRYVLLLSVSALALGACGTRYTVVPPPIPEGLLQDCPDPRLIPDSTTQTMEQIEIERVEVAQYARCNYLKFDGARKYIRGLSAK